MDRRYFGVSDCCLLYGSFVVDGLQVLVKRIDSVSEKMPRLLRPLMCPINERLDESLRLGADTVGWLSSTAGEFLLSADDAVTDWELLVHRATELVSQRIFARFRELENIVLCPMSNVDELPFTVDQFLDYVRVSSTEQRFL